MSIITLQRRMRELGRIRAGDKGDKGQPRKLTEWRITSAQRPLLDEAAGLWGGTVSPWESPSGPQWELYTATDTLPIVIAGDSSISQFMELWTGGGCQRRCDGETELLTDQPCMCDPDPEKRKCKPTTRVNVMLPDLSDIGQWRLELHGYYGAVEMAGIADLLAMAKAQFIPAQLRLEPRQVRRPNEPVRKFVVPVIEMNVRLGDVLSSLGLTGPQAAVDAPTRPQLAQSTPEATDDDWTALYALLDAGADPQSMATLEADLRKLYLLMERCRVPGWETRDGIDALHRALTRHQRADHVGDLRRAQLEEFCTQSWEGAQAAVKETGAEE